MRKKNWLKRASCLVLAAMMLFSLAMTAMAAEAEDIEDIEDTEAVEEPVLRAPHTHRFVDDPNGNKWTKYVYLNANQCKAYTHIPLKCVCGSTSERVEEEELRHKPVVISSTCDGSYQTWKMVCNYCGTFLYNRPELCPGGPHTGLCRWPPV